MTTKLKCLLLDDELPSLKYLKMLCELIPELEVLKAFDNVENFLREFPLIKPDLCILDIEMPGMDGLSVANLLAGKPVIFVTAYKEYAADAFDIDAVDYIRKPVTRERLQVAVNKVLNRIQQSDQIKRFVHLNTDKGKTLLFFDEIAFIGTSETDSRDKIAMLNDGKIFVLKNISFEKLLQVLPEGGFCQVNKKEVVALRAVRFFSHDEVTTKIIQPTGRPLTLTLGFAYREEFLKKIKL